MSAKDTQLCVTVGCLRVCHGVLSQYKKDRYHKVLMSKEEGQEQSTTSNSNKVIVYQVLLDKVLQEKGTTVDSQHTPRQMDV